MAMDYLKEGDQETLADGTLVEKNEKGIIVHNVPSDKGIFKDAVLESWIDGVIADKDYEVKDKEGKDTLAKRSILNRITGTCASQWGIDPKKIAEALKIIYTTPLYSSAKDIPSLNHTSKSCHESAKYYTKVSKLDEFSIEDLLYAIESQHCCGKYDGHPHITLWGDGSGSVIGRFQDKLSSFQTLRQFIESSNETMDYMDETETTEDAEDFSSASEETLD